LSASRTGGASHGQRIRELVVLDRLARPDLEHDELVADLLVRLLGQRPGVRGGG